MKSTENPLHGDDPHQTASGWPSQIVVAREEWDRLVAKLPTHQKIIVELLRRGYTHREIADKIGVDEKTIRRLIRRIAPEFLPDEESRQASPV